MFKRAAHSTLMKRFHEPRRFIQVIAGPRQVGKTTLAKQAMESLPVPFHYASADEPMLRDNVWLEEQWEIGRLKVKDSAKGCVLILDEVQKLPNWSNTVKFLWDMDSRKKVNLKVALLGSSPLLIQRGLTESLAGRFEIVPLSHWSYAEMREAFGFSVEQYIYFGGYPGAATLINDENRWRRYILDSLIETTISKDILLMTRVDKPALLRRLFQLGCDYSAQILSYQKMIGQLHDAGNTTTLAHYLDLLAGAGMLAGLQKYSGKKVRQRGSSPKLLVLNTALMSASTGLTFETARNDRNYWGRLVETAVGAHLYNSLLGHNGKLQYWREANKEVDYVVTGSRKNIAIEVKSGSRKEALPGMDAFNEVYPSAQMLLIGGQGLSIEEALSSVYLPE